MLLHYGQTSKANNSDLFYKETNNRVQLSICYYFVPFALFV